jgi:hypothetical protein
MNKWYRKVSQEVLRKCRRLGNFPITSAEMFNQVYVATKIVSLEKRKLVPFEDTFVYTLESLFTFGKHKGNPLGCVYKIDPGYVEWCIENAEGFIIHPDTFQAMKKSRVFIFDDLLPYCEGGSHHQTINLKSFKEIDDFPYSNSVR